MKVIYTYQPYSTSNDNNLYLQIIPTYLPTPKAATRASKPELWEPALRAAGSKYETQ